MSFFGSAVALTDQSAPRAMQLHYLAQRDSLFTLTALMPCHRLLILRRFQPQHQDLSCTAALAFHMQISAFSK
jgi:hypothetical protein